MVLKKFKYPVLIYNGEHQKIKYPRFPKNSNNRLPKKELSILFMKPGGSFRVLEYLEPCSFFLNLIYFNVFVEIAGMEESRFILKF